MLKSYLNLPIKILFYILVSILLRQFFTFPVSAQEGAKQMIRISPVILKVELSPGREYRYTIKVENLLLSPMPINVAVSGFEASNEEGGVSVLDQGTPSPLIDWITLDENQTIIPATSQKEFNVRVNVPKEVPIGGYFAVIFFTPVFPDKPIEAKVGVVVLANIGVPFDKERKAQISTFTFDKLLYEKGPIQTTIRVKNTSLNYFSAKPTLTIKPLFGEEKIFELEEKTILPGKARRWQKPLDVGNLRGVIYQAHLTVSLEQGDSISATQTFYGLPFTKIVLSVFAIAITVYGILFRKRVIKALRLLAKG